MLQIRNISKQYKTGNLIQQALNNVSLNLRENEFVAILGPSGSGKTTLLNIIGGLDSYDSGDLIINSISTKNYNDKDWDSYRNHTIGFVFQSYNLIPHQSILANVELALTISGVSSDERRRRALDALRQVGLREQAHKLPAQLSGGQMQRVAIARALVNDPKILLADEPTGALDSDTSIQVMDLLKEVARDRLVVMVTHNPELAQKYATRIVTLRDGKITGDSNPYHIDNYSPAKHKNMGRSSMSFWTALTLSFKNLLTKKTRTLLVSFAGSIGIIGIALILALSNGVNSYIRGIEEETLSEYPLTVQSTSFDLTSMMMVRMEIDEADVVDNDQIKEVQIVNGLLSSTGKNDLASLKTFLDSDERISSLSKAIEYTYSVSPQIYRADGEGYRKINPDESLSALGFSSDSILTSSYRMTNAFEPLPQQKELYIDQYEVKAGHWPEKYNECVLVLTNDGSVLDWTLYSLGLRDSKELDEMIAAFLNGENPETHISDKTYTYSDFIGLTFKLVSSADYYVFDEKYGAWLDKTDDTEYMKNLIANGEDITIVGVVQRKPNTDVGMLYTGVGYPFELIEHVVQVSAEKEATRAQLANEDINIFTGQEFGEETSGRFRLEEIINIDTKKLKSAFKFDISKINLDMDDLNIDFVSVIKKADLDIDFSQYVSQLEVNIHPENFDNFIAALLREYFEYASQDPQTDYSALPQAIQAYFNDPETVSFIRELIAELFREKVSNMIKPSDVEALVINVMEGYPAWAEQHGYTEQTSAHILEYLRSDGKDVLQGEINRLLSKAEDSLISGDDVKNLLAAIVADYQEYARENGAPDIEKLSESFMTFLKSEQGQKVINDHINDIINADELEAQIERIYGEAEGDINKNMSKLIRTLIDEIFKSIKPDDLAKTFASALTINTSKFASAFSLNMTVEDIQSVLSSLFSGGETVSYRTNLKNLDYADLNEPARIAIYPNDFSAKLSIKDILDEYNHKMQKEDESKVITYTDTVGTLMSSVTTIVSTISYVLVAFVSISLVVSSIMIGVITYISVLERRKEIGILRAIGASKRNISNVFNAETFIIGLLAGSLGIGLTHLLLIPINYIIHYLTENNEVNAFLPVKSALILIVLSVILTLIGGLIPSSKAAKQDPVAALRTE